MTLSRKWTAVRTVCFSLASIQRVDAVFLLQVGHQVDGAKVARLVGQQRLLAAGIGGRSPAGDDVVLVQAVQEDDARLAGLPSRVHDGLEHLAGVEAATVSRVAGSTRAYSVLASTACIKASVMPTEMLKW